MLICSGTGFSLCDSPADPSSNIWLGDSMEKSAAWINELDYQCRRAKWSFMALAWQYRQGKKQLPKIYPYWDLSLLPLCLTLLPNCCFPPFSHLAMLFSLSLCWILQWFSKLLADNQKPCNWFMYMSTGLHTGDDKEISYQCFWVIPPCLVLKRHFDKSTNLMNVVDVVIRKLDLAISM